MSSIAADGSLERAFCQTAQSPADRILSWEAPCLPGGKRWEPILCFRSGLVTPGRRWCMTVGDAAGWALLT